MNKTLVLIPRGCITPHKTSSEYLTRFDEAFAIVTTQAHQPQSKMASLFNEDSERGIDPPSKNTLQRGAYDEVLTDPNKLRMRQVWLLESVQHYREIDIARNYTYVIPRGIGGRPIVSGKTNCIEGLKVMYDAASKYFHQSSVGKSKTLLVKFRKAKPKSCHPKLPTPRVDKTAAMRIEALDANENIIYSLAASTIGVRGQWQIFKEDIKPKTGMFDLMPYRLKYFGDLDMDLKDGMVVDFSVCDCNWHASEQGRTLQLMGAGPVLKETCIAVGSSLKPECWGCESIYQIQEVVRRL